MVWYRPRLPTRPLCVDLPGPQHSTKNLPSISEQKHRADTDQTEIMSQFLYIVAVAFIALTVLTLLLAPVDNYLQYCCSGQRRFLLQVVYYRLSDEEH